MQVERGTPALVSPDDVRHELTAVPTRCCHGCSTDTARARARWKLLRVRHEAVR